MRIKLNYLWIAIPIALSMGLSGCSSLSPEAVDAFSEQTPEGVTAEFFEWYSQYPGNPLHDHAYRENSHLTEAFIGRMDALLTETRAVGFDPFLCAQDVPESFQIQDQPRSGKQASVEVRSNFPDHAFIVDLLQVEGAWRINGIHCTDSEAAFPLPEGPVAVTPEGVVHGFYSWYLWYAHEQGNPLADHVYQESAYLAESFMQKVDDVLSSSGPGGFDPILCAQDLPQRYSLDGVVQEGDHARVNVRSSFPDHAFTVVLQHADQRWLISDVLCERSQ